MRSPRRRRAFRVVDEREERGDEGLREVRAVLREGGAEGRRRPLRLGEVDDELRERAVADAELLVEAAADLGHELQLRELVHGPDARALEARLARAYEEDMRSLLASSKRPSMSTP